MGTEFKKSHFVNFWDSGSRVRSKKLRAAVIFMMCYFFEFYQLPGDLSILTMNSLLTWTNRPSVITHNCRRRKHLVIIYDIKSK